MNQSKKAIEKLRGTFNTANPTGQALMGATAGVVTGYVTSRIGRKISFATGTGIILYQVAQSQGLVKVTWNDLMQKAENATKDTKWCEKGNSAYGKFQTIFKDNTPFTAGFIGGFLIGVS